MPNHHLWTAPCPGVPSERAIEWVESLRCDRVLWLLPSELARAQVESLSTTRGKGSWGGCFWLWEDFWLAVREWIGAGPTLLKDAATRFVLSEAIKRTRDAGRLSRVSDLLNTPGYHRRLTRLFS